ncbi:MAG: Asp-tRNA(Asn)/Glu-tRNA(Gln) amidotransferase subunit GatB [Bacteroidota bacterium]
MEKTIADSYQLVAGLEIHAQLSTQSKAYCSDSTEYGAIPNTLVCPISLGHPGTLPKPNKKVLEFAVKLGLALHCSIRRENQYARKNYFYADLPKGYQITQDKTPICTNGFLEIKDAEGNPKKIRIQRIHMEEDAGKSIHDQSPDGTLIDLNRAGVALLEIVTEPDFRSTHEIGVYLTEMRKILRYLEICDGNMEEGSMRCDANVSVMKKGTANFGNRVEVKNMNSIRNVQRAVEFEVQRQVAELEEGRSISQDTRSFDAGSGTTFLMRSKEQANDYRYFPEPDLQPLFIEETYVQEVKSGMPALPSELFRIYTETYKLPEYDAMVITENKLFSAYFGELIGFSDHHKACANWMMGPVKSWLNENAREISGFPLHPHELAGLIQLVESGKVSHSVAAQKLFPLLLENPKADAQELAAQHGWIQESDSQLLMGFVQEVIALYPDKAEAYRQGKKGLLGLFMGELMKRSGGKADPKVATALLQEALEKTGI